MPQSPNSQTPWDHPQWTSPLVCNSLVKGLDMTIPALIFGGLLATAVAICGTLDASSPTSVSQIEEPTVVTDENVSGVISADPVAACGRDRRIGRRCRREQAPYSQVAAPF